MPFHHSFLQVVEPFRSLKVTKNDVDIFLRQYTLAITEAGFGTTVDGGSRQLATLLMENEVISKYSVSYIEADLHLKQNYYIPTPLNYRLLL